MQTEDGRGALVSPAADRPGAWRVTTFGDDGKPSGHIDAPTKRDAVVRALEDGYQARAPQTERTSAGEQTLFENVAPITDRNRLDARLAQPLRRGHQPSDDTQIGALFGSATCPLDEA